MQPAEALACLAHYRWRCFLIHVSYSFIILKLT